MPAQDAAEAAEFAALVAELSAEEVTGEEPGDEEAAQDESSDDPGEEQSEEEPEPEADEEEPEQDDPDEDSEEDEDEEPPLELNLSGKQAALREQLESGNLRAALALLGVTPKALGMADKDFDASAGKFAALRKSERSAVQKLKSATTLERQGRQLHEAAEATYGPIVAGFQGHQGGRPLDVKAAIELMCEDTFENVINGIVRAVKGLSPAEAELLKVKQERVKEKDAENARKATEAAQAQEAKEVTALTGRLKGTPLEKVPDAAKEIRALVVASFDGVGYGTTVKEAYATVKAKYAGIAEAVTGKKLPPKNGKRPPVVTGKKRSELTPLRPAAAALTPAEKEKARKAAEAEEFRASVREASAAGNRLGRRYGRS